MSKIAIVGTEHMAQALPICLGELGNMIVPLKDCDVCWIAIDTPVDNEGRGDAEPILKAIKGIRHQIKDGVLVIVSSQIPVGTSKDIVKLLGEKFYYAYMPEHMKIGTGVSDFMGLTDVVVGVDDVSCKAVLLSVFLGKKVMFTSVATAEMIKHATNAFLATSACFIYDIADVCEATGADVVDVSKALKLDYRIGKEAYLDASVGFSGGHLERDLDYLQKVAKLKKVNIPVIDAVVDKNTKRRKIVLDKLGNVKGKKVAFWGITYKPGVAPSDNSLPAKLMRDLTKLGAEFDFCDPWYRGIDPYSAVEDCMAIICITPWEDLRSLNFERVSSLMLKPKILFDARNYFVGLEDAIEDAGLKYIGVGR